MCWQLLAVIEEAVARHADEVRLLIFERGASWSEEPCPALKANIHRGGGGVPLSYMGGKFLMGACVYADRSRD